jgi:hypothetical protein
MEDSKKLQELKQLSIKKEQLRSKINELRRLKKATDDQINDLVREMILAD